MAEIENRTSRRFLGPRAQRWLKTFHVLLATMWLGGGLCLVLLDRTRCAASAGELIGHCRAMVIIDDWIIVPGAIGLLLTGLLYSIWTRWGWFKHFWIAVKWIIMFTGVLVGTFVLGPWLTELYDLARQKGLAALSDPDFLELQTRNGLIAIAQVSTIVLALLLSTLKPKIKTSGRGAH
ncbi:MAG: DUF2269 family protein [Deltaproteobacteria bacterium]|nr:DUF2269 family protein [Deltaproteobacteria bacterium]